MIDNKFPEKYQYIHQQIKDHHKTEGYEVEWIDEIYLPFWICKQEVYVQTELVPDEFSKILFRLIDSGVKSRNEICQFLGVKEDDFTLAQIDYLINEKFLEENFLDDNSIYYEITHGGREFFEEKIIIKHIETDEIEYIIPEIEHIVKEKYETFFNDLNQEFFNKNESIDTKSKLDFSGYKPIATHKLEIDEKYPPNCIKHGDKPTLKKIKESNFVKFFDKNHEHFFYDFNENKPIEAHKRSIKFYLIYFLNEEDKVSKVEIRHCPESVNKSDEENPILEAKLSKLATEYLKERDSKFIERLKEYRKEKTKPKYPLPLHRGKG